MQYVGLDSYEPGSTRAALVTGATGALGSALVVQLAQEGWDVVLQYFSNDAKAKELQTAETNIGRVHAVKCDLSAGPGAVAELMDEVASFAPTLDALVHCAAAPVPITGFDADGAEQFARLCNLHVNCLVDILGHVLPRMKLRQHGTIVGVLSESLLPFRIPGWSAYNAAKMAALSYLMDLAEDVAPTGVRAIGVLPGAFKDGKAIFPNDPRGQAVLKDVQRRWPIGLAASEVAKLLVEVLLDEKSHPNGQLLAISPQEGTRALTTPFAKVEPQPDRKIDGDRKDTSVEGQAPAQAQADDPLQSSLEDTFRKVFRLSEDDPVSEAQLGTWAVWDSLKHLDLLMSVEREMDVNFADEDGSALVSFAAILQAVRKQLDGS